jgi:hypothetical protein
VIFPSGADYPAPSSSVPPSSLSSPQILIKKSYTDRHRRRRRRQWRLKMLPKEEGLLRKDEVDHMATQFEAYMDDVDQDPELRGAINLYKGELDAWHLCGDVNIHFLCALGCAKNLYILPASRLISLLRLQTSWL